MWLPAVFTWFWITYCLCFIFPVCIKYLIEIFIIITIIIIIISTRVNLYLTYSHEFWKASMALLAPLQWRFYRKRQFLFPTICLAQRIESINYLYWIITENCIPSLQTPHKVCLSVQRHNIAHNFQCYQKFSLSNSPNNTDTFIFRGWKIHINVERAFKTTENHSR
jgi:hypothetical protein